MKYKNILLVLGFAFFITVIVSFVVYESRINLSGKNTFLSKINSSSNQNNAVLVAKDNYQMGENLEFKVTGVSEVEAEEFEVEIKNSEDPNFQIESSVNEVFENGEANFEVMPEAGMVPGKYIFRVLDKDGNVILEQDFLWGVLAINTNKSIYLPDEKVDFSIGVLDENGNMVCDADVSLEVKAFNGQSVALTTKEGTIKVNEECRVKAYTQKPDYEASILTGVAGKYDLKLTAVTKNGTYIIDDFFEVRNSVPFDIERISATRIYPPEIYPVKIRVKANQDFKGKIVEFVPTDFKITQMEESGVASFNLEDEENNYDLPPETKALIWEVDLKVGEELILGYRYKSPEVSPYFYLLGPLSLFPELSSEAIFSETRRWQIAVDGLEFPTRLDRRRTVNTNGSGTSTVVYLPDGSNDAGNLILLLGASGGNGGITLPAGWTQLNQGGTGFDQSQGIVGYRVLDGTEGFDGTDDSITVTYVAGQTAFYMITFTTHGSSLEASVITGLSGLSPNPPSLVPTWGLGKHYWIAFAVSDCWLPAYTVFPSGYSYTDSYVVGGTECFTTGVAEREADAASQDPSSFQAPSGSNDWRALTIAVKEAWIPEPKTIIKGGTQIRAGTILKQQE